MISIPTSFNFSDSRTPMESFQLILGFVILILIFIVVFRIYKNLFFGDGLKKEDAKFYSIKPVVKCLIKRKEPNAKLIEKYAEDFEKRALLFECLTKFNRQDLFPEQYRAQEKLSESYLANWLNVDDEYDSFPNEIKFSNIYILKDNLKVLEFKFKSYEPHIFANKDWIYGYVVYEDEHTLEQKPKFICSDFNNKPLTNEDLINRFKR